MSDQLPLNLSPPAQDNLRLVSESPPSESPPPLFDPQITPTHDPVSMIAHEVSRSPNDPAPEPPSPSPKPPKRAALEIPRETRTQISALSQHYGTRRIADRVGLSRKQVRRVLIEARQDAMHPPA